MIGPFMLVLCGRRCLLLPFSACYFALLPLGFHFVIFDRYLLPLTAIAIIYLLKLHQQWVAPTLPFISLVMLGIFGLLAIAGTHDWFECSRARIATIDEIRASGVPTTEIQGGFEYDGWAQIELGKYINDPRIAVPPDAYHPNSDPQAVAEACRFTFDRNTPAIQPKYTIVFPKMPCLAPSHFPPVDYRTWLPPFHGTILVQEIPNADH